VPKYGAKKPVLPLHTLKLPGALLLPLDQVLHITALELFIMLK